MIRSMPAESTVRIKGEFEVTGAQGPVAHRAVGFALCTAAMFLVPMTVVKLGPVPVADFFIFAAAASSLVAARKSLPFLPTLEAAGWLTSTVALIGVAAAFATILDPLLETNWRQYGEFAVALAVVPGLILLHSRQRGYAQLLRAYILGTFVSAVVALTAHSPIDVESPILRFFEEINWRRPQGLTTHPNQLGLMSLLGLGLLLVQNTTTTTHRLVRLAQLIVFVLAVSASGSRAAIVGLVLLALGYLAIVRGDLLSLVRTTFGIVAAAAIAVPTRSIWFPKLGLALSRLAGASDEFASVEVSDQQRTENFSRAVMEIQSRPILGNGFSASDAHNFFANLLQVAGIPLGIFLIASITWLTGQSLWTAIVRGKQHDPESWLALVVAVWLVVSAFGNGLSERYLFVPFALLLASQNDRSRRRRTASSRNQTTRAAIR